MKKLMYQYPSSGSENLVSYSTDYVVYFSAILLACVFYVYPAADLAISNFFYTIGEGFALKHNYMLQYINEYARVFAVLVILWCVLSIIVTYFKYDRQSTTFFDAIKKTLYVLLVCAIGPGLLVHLLKDNFGRARPEAVKEFGKTAAFTPAWVVSDQCARNCSFVSGHAAAGFMLLPFAFVASSRRKTIMWYTLAIVHGAVFGFIRIAFGKHFFSDVLFAGFIVYAVSHVMALLFKLNSEIYVE